MNTNDFYQKLAEALEIEGYTLTGDTVISEIKEIDSLEYLTLISFIDESFNKTISIDKLKSMTTVSSLMDIIGSDCFNN